MTKALKCKCDACGDLVTEWIGIVCVPCHDKAVTKTLRDAALPFATAHYEEGYYGTGGRRLKADFAVEDVATLKERVKPYG